MPCQCLCRRLQLFTGTQTDKFLTVTSKLRFEPRLCLRGRRSVPTGAHAASVSCCCVVHMPAHWQSPSGVIGPNQPHQSVWLTLSCNAIFLEGLFPHFSLATSLIQSILTTFSKIGRANCFRRDARSRACAGLGGGAKKQHHYGPRERIPTRS